MNKDNSSKIKDLIRTIPNYPKNGIMFRDITTLIGDAEGLKLTLDAFCEFASNLEFDIVAGIEARGFIFAPMVAYKMNKPFVPIRKKGKLPGKTLSQNYKLEYGEDTIEMHEGAVTKGQKVLLIDDLLATGGTATAAAQLIIQAGGIVEHSAFVVDLPDLHGKDVLNAQNINVHCIVEFEGE